MHKCINCVYEGNESKNEKFCPVCGDNLNLDSDINVSLDFNNDGQIDHKDASLGAKAMNKVKSLKRKKKSTRAKRGRK